ncbi:GFA family protein [Mesorhizobium sp. WSM2239]|uniref:GFA family protein n=2 Tax=unclassified Mesorhizobium TaxID=325217 RepID=A0AAU8D7J3_9HYPH
MAEPQVREGGCQCGTVRFRVKGNPIRAGICHCLDCRKAGGSFYSAFAIWPRDAFEGAGAVGTYEGRSFCLYCGGRVYSLRDDEAEIMLGSLDQAPGDIAPEYELWIGRREEWMEPLPWAAQFQHDREPIADPATGDEAPPQAAQQPET